MNKITALQAVILSATVLVFGCLIDILVRKWTVQNNFFTMRLIEIFQFVVTFSAVFIAGLLGYSLNQKLSNSEKIREHVIKMLEELKAQIKVIYDLGNKYTENPEDFLSSQIMLAASDAELKITLLQKLNSEVSVDGLDVSDSLEISYWKFRSSLTDSPFKENNAKYTLEQKKKINENFNNLNFKIEKCELQLFTRKLDKKK
jgi:predicted MPP superfamily phosphohydrolase